MLRGSLWLGAASDIASEIVSEIALEIASESIGDHGECHGGALVGGRHRWMFFVEVARVRQRKLWHGCTKRGVYLCRGCA